MGKRRQTRGSVIISGRLNNRSDKAALFRTAGNVYAPLSILRYLFIFLTFNLYYSGTLNHLGFPLTFRCKWIWGQNIYYPHFRSMLTVFHEFFNNKQKPKTSIPAHSVASLRLYRCLKINHCYTSLMWRRKEVQQCGGGHTSNHQMLYFGLNTKETWNSWNSNDGAQIHCEGAIYPKALELTPALFCACVFIIFKNC